MGQRSIAFVVLSILFTAALAACSEAGPPTATLTFEETQASVRTFMSAAHEIYYDARSVANDPLLFDGDAKAAEAVREARALFRALRDRIDDLEPPADEDAVQIVEDFNSLVDSMRNFLDAFQQRSGEGEGDLTGRLETLFRTASFDTRDGFQTFFEGRLDMFERYDIPPAEFPLNPVSQR